MLRVNSCVISREPNVIHRISSLMTPSATLGTNCSSLCLGVLAANYPVTAISPSHSVSLTVVFLFLLTASVFIQLYIGEVEGRSSMRFFSVDTCVEVGGDDEYHQPLLPYGMLVFGGFDGQLKSDVLVYVVRDCTSLSTKELCLTAMPGVKCVWNKAAKKCEPLASLFKEGYEKCPGTSFIHT